MLNNIITSDNQSNFRSNDEYIIPKQELLPSSLPLQELEEIIQRALNGFVKAGAALRTIKDNKLYKDIYSTYDEYCQKRWGFSPQHANRLIKAATVVEKIESEPIGSVLPQSEGQARALSKSENPANDWKKIQDETRKEQPTAKEIEIFIKEQSKDDVIDAEIAEELPAETEPVNTPSLLEEIINTPYERGERTGRAQVCVEADDDTFERLERLKEQFGFGSTKASIVAHSLIFLEKSLESITDISLKKG